MLVFFNFALMKKFGFDRHAANASMAPLALQFSRRELARLEAVNFKRLYDETLEHPNGARSCVLAELAEIIGMCIHLSAMSCTHKIPPPTIAELISYREIIHGEAENRKRPLSVNETLFALVVCESIANYFSYPCGHPIPETPPDRARTDDSISRMFYG